MALKKQIAKLEDVAENLRSLYTQKGDVFILDIDGDEDVEGLKKKNKELIEEKRQAQKARDDAAESARIAAEEAARKNGSLEELEKSLNAKHQAEIQKRDDLLASRDKMILGGKKEALLADLANNFISPTAAKLMLNNLVDVSYGEDGQVGVRFNGLDGKPVTTDPTAFITHLSGIDDFKPMIKGSSANGGGASGGSNPPTGRTMSRQSFEALDPHAKASFMKEGNKVV